MRSLILLGTSILPITSFGASAAPEVSPKLAPLLFLLALGLVYRTTRAK